MYVPMRNVIQCMGDMALMPKICKKKTLKKKKKKPIFGNFWRFLGPLEPRWDPISFSRRPMNDNFIFGALNHVCTKEKFDLMYGWYGSNGHYMWKIANFGDFWWFFGPLEARWDPISFTRRHMNDYFIFGTLNHVCTNEKFNSMHGWYGSNAQNIWKTANFGCLKKWFLVPLEPR